MFGDTISTDGHNSINTDIVAELARAITNVQPDLVLFIGDFAYSGSVTSYRLWTNLMTPVYRAGIRIYPTVGNHDSDDLPGFASVFGPSLPTNGPAGEHSATYAVTHSNALFLLLNQIDREYQLNQPWIDSVLATNTQPHVFAFGHYTAFKTYHPSCLGDYPADRNAFWNSLSNAHARIYFCGDDHFYDHARLDDGDGNRDNDLHQFIVGTGGAPLYTGGAYDGNNAIWTPVGIFREVQFGFLLVEVNGNAVQTTWYHRTAAKTYLPTTEVFGYSVTPAIPVLSIQRIADTVTLTWSGLFNLQASPSLEGEFIDIPTASSPYTLTNLPGPARFFRLTAP